jgi:hypothetical protein
MKHVRRRVLTTAVGVAAVIAAGMSTAGATSYTAAEFLNPGFEDPVISTASPYYQNFTTGASIGAWTVTAGDVDLIVPPYPKKTGEQALDLNGFGAGTIQQTFAVNPGLHYSILYWVNTNGGTQWNIDVSSNGVSLANGNGDYANPPAGLVTDGTWQQWGPPDVVPTGTTMTVTLTSLDSGFGGVVLDDFLVTYTDVGPAVSGLAVSSNGKFVHLTGTAANAVDGQGDVTAAQYQLSRGSWTGPWVDMAAADGAFDEASEDVVADIALPAYVGSYDVCVRAENELTHWTDTPVCLTNAFTVNVVASGPIVANTDHPATINSATNKGEPDYVVDAVAGMVGTVPVGYVNINYKNLAPVQFLPGGTTAFTFYFGYDSVDMGAWHADEIDATSIQFMNNGGLPGYPRGGFWMNFAGSTPYAIPASTVPSWAPGVPFDRGGVTVWPTS